MSRFNPMGLSAETFSAAWLLILDEFRHRQWGAARRQLPYGCSGSTVCVCERSEGL